MVIAPAADFGWSIIKALIERKLGIEMPHAVIGEEDVPILDPQRRPGCARSCRSSRTFCLQ